MISVESSLRPQFFQKKKFLYNSNLGMSRPWFVLELLNSKFINTSPSKILFKTPLINPCLKFTIVNSSPFLKMILFLPKHSRNLLQIQIYFKIIQVLAKSLLMKTKLMPGNSQGYTIHLCRFPILLSLRLTSQSPFPLFLKENCLFATTFTP